MPTIQSRKNTSNFAKNQSGPAPRCEFKLIREPKMVAHGPKPSHSPTTIRQAGRQQFAHQLYQSVGAGTLDAVILAYWVWGYTASLGTASMALVLLVAIASR